MSRLLIYQVFETDSYNQLIRPVEATSGFTVVSTELKLHQIDLVVKEGTCTLVLSILVPEDRLCRRPSQHLYTFCINTFGINTFYLYTLCLNTLCLIAF